MVAATRRSRARQEWGTVAGVGVAMRWLSVAAHGRAGVLLSLVLLTDAALLCVEVDMSARQRGAQAVLRPGVPIFALVYFAELLYRLHAWALRGTRPRPHAFDGLVTLVSVGADILRLAAKPRATRVALALRTLRLLRLFTTLRRFRSSSGASSGSSPSWPASLAPSGRSSPCLPSSASSLAARSTQATRGRHDHQTAEAQRFIYCASTAGWRSSHSSSC